MAQAGDIAAMVRTVEGLLSEKLGIAPRPLPGMVKKAGRRLPRRMRARAQVLIEAAQKAGHPKLARQLDHRAITRAHDELKAHLEAIDLADQRRGRVLALAGTLAFNMIFVAAAFVFWIWWRGYL